MTDYVHINQIYGRYFGLNPPVRVCVQSAIRSYALIEALASPSVPQKRVMHVQSISHWAPANIGPYSQCTEVKDKNIEMLTSQPHSYPFRVLE